MSQYKGFFQDKDGNDLLPVAANFAPTEASNVASKSYAKGEHFIWNFNLYKATTSIAQGSTFVVNTNCQLVPYIADEIQETQNVVSMDLLQDTVGWTGKNLLRITSNTQTVAGVTYTVNGDGSISISGTATGASNFAINDDRLTAGDYIISCEYSGTTSGSSPLLANTLYNSDGTTKTGDYADIQANGSDKEREFTVSGTDYLSFLRFYVASGNTVDCVVKPMIRKADVLDSTFEPYHDSVETMYEEEIHGVNLLKNTATTTTQDGITFTVNADKSVKLNGTASATTILELTDPIVGLDNGTSYKLTGCPSGGSASTYKLDFGDPSYIDYGSGTVVSGNVLNGVKVRIVVYSGATVSNLMFYPEIRKAEIDDPTYRPYNSQAIQNQINDKGVLGAKNLLAYPYYDGTSKTTSGITYTVDSNGVVTANGTATDTAVFVMQYKPNLQDNVKYILSGCPSGGSASTYCVQYSNNYNAAYKDFGSGVEITKFNYTTYRTAFCIIAIYSGQTVSNLRFYPMIRLASDPDDTYQPHAMTNRELTEKVNDKIITVTSDTGALNFIEQVISQLPVLAMYAEEHGYVIRTGSDTYRYEAYSGNGTTLRIKLWKGNEILTASGTGGGSVTAAYRYEGTSLT